MSTVQGYSQAIAHQSIADILESCDDAFYADSSADKFIAEQFHVDKVQRELLDSDVVDRVLTCFKRFHRNFTVGFHRKLYSPTYEHLNHEFIDRFYNQLSNKTEVARTYVEEKNVLILLRMIAQGFSPFNRVHQMDPEHFLKHLSGEEFARILTILRSKQCRMPWKQILKVSVFKTYGDKFCEIIRKFPFIPFTEIHLRYALAADQKELFAAIHTEKVAFTEPIPKKAVLDPSWRKIFVEDLRISPNQGDKDGTDAVHTAASAGCLDAIKYFAEKGADIMPVNADGKTPLHYACSNNNKDIVEYFMFTRRLSLTDSYADNGRSPVYDLPRHEIVSSGYTDLFVRFLSEVCHPDMDRIYREMYQVKHAFRPILFGLPEKDLYSPLFVQNGWGYIATILEEMSLSSGTLIGMRGLLQECTEKTTAKRLWPTIQRLKEMLVAKQPKARVVSEQSFKEEFAEKDIFEILADILLDKDYHQSVHQGRKDPCIDFFGCSNQQLYSAGIQSGADLLALGYPIQLEELACEYESALNKAVVKARIIQYDSKLETLETTVEAPKDRIVDLFQMGLNQHLRSQKGTLIKKYLLQGYELLESYLNANDCESLSEYANQKKLEPFQCFNVTDDTVKRRRRDGQ